MSSLRNFFKSMDPDAPDSAADAADGNASTSNAAGAVAAGPTPKSLGMRGDDKPKQPNLQLTQEDYKKITPNEPTEVARADVEKELTKFLQDLGKTQGYKNNVVKSSDKVWQADVALHEGLKEDPSGLFTPTGGDGHEYDAAELAGKIAGQLPDTIPIETFRKFRAMAPKETKLPGSTTDQIRKKYEEARDAIVAKLPEKVRKYAREGMDAAVQKGISYVAGAAMKDAGVPADVEKELEKIVDDYGKKITGDDKKKKDK